MTIQRYRHDTFTPSEFNRELTQLGMSEGEFSKLTGVRERTLRNWLDPDGDGPPYFARMFLALMASDRARLRP